MGIKEVRKSKHMTQKQLADAIGVDFSVISKYEKGIINPPANRLASIAEVLNVSVDYLISSNQYIETRIETHHKSISDSVDADKYIRLDSDVTKRILAYAKGVCELCGQPAPFKDANGEPYLETHHIEWLSDGGLPVPQNTVALCPNCHTRIHVLNAPSDIEKLKRIAHSHLD